jgi:hypothetical protein
VKAALEQRKRVTGEVGLRIVQAAKVSA